ncbi:secretory pathway protein Ssp120 [Histoplasma capsulatum var. duboisii H88]|uniref:Secretory pathway protein Ssp120 n=1 Tax=Ajellomyces capsulatus (strain H88) TaxID=544711 RepID=F0UMT1_AJEC8|nr:secretory pathway protein Ssp120 [Histoplasma capsulatum var. duboisii H88]QSS53572.1 secretory pathway protein Ssp120 [Histoplasma capsulatum var. duboisii H88]
MIALLVAFLAVTRICLAHGSHENIGDVKDWATRHMLEEHHISNFDPGSFFLLHDYDNSGVWTVEEVRRTYGLDDNSNASLTEDRKQQILKEIFSIFDPQKTGVISQHEWMRLSREGKKLPDFGTGPGHHGDLEYEYEIHHFEKYHGDGATEEDLTHPEDIEHFRQHDHAEDAQIRLANLQKMPIVEANIPVKFLKSPSAR